MIKHIIYFCEFCLSTTTKRRGEKREKNNNNNKYFRYLMLRWKIANKSFDCCHTSAVCTHHHNPCRCLIMYNIMFILYMLRVCVEMGSVYGCRHKSRPRKTFEYLWVSLFRSMMDDDEGMRHYSNREWVLLLLLLCATVARWKNHYGERGVVLTADIRLQLD